MEREEFELILKDIVSNKVVREMKNYRQHYSTTCFDHCYDAAYTCFLICKKLNWDYVSATRGAMLHDLFLYDWRKKDNRTNKWHAFTHGKIACENAKKEFILTEKEQDIIKSHMWPLTVKLPKSKEAMLLTFVDKYCALKEFKNHVVSQIKTGKVFRYATFLYMFIISKF